MIYELIYDAFDHVVEKNYDDIMEYEFKKNFQAEYSCFAFCNANQRAFVKNFENRRDNNAIHYYDYYTTHNPEFLAWLRDKYEDEARIANEEHLYDDPDEWWYDLDEDEKIAIMRENW